MQSKQSPIIIMYLLLVGVSIGLVSAYTTDGGNGRYLDRRAMAGLWKLSRLPSQQQFPLKEFTVHPPKKTTNEQKQQQQHAEEEAVELLLVLNEDGSFKRYFNIQENDTQQQTQKDDDEDEEDSIDVSWDHFMNYQKNLDPSWSSLIKGTWDFREGNLILAADRIDDITSASGTTIDLAKQRNYMDTMYQRKSDGIADSMTTDTNKDDSSNSASSSSSSASSSSVNTPKRKDTILVGEVVVTQEQGGATQKDENNKNNEIADQDKDNIGTSTASSSNPVTISVPKSSLKVGKFMYPKKHHLFFDQPKNILFQPKSKGIFQLRQILGTSTMGKSQEDDEEEIIEKFSNKDFYNKRFLLTSQPLKERKKKKGDTLRWSLKHKKFIDENDMKQSMNNEKEDENRAVVPIRVMEVMFHSNNTFSSIAGVGDSMILRGNFDVIGDEKDRLYMQIRRFGFGRSVSQTYSEGRGLSHEDAKTYWGQISYEDEDYATANDIANDIENNNNNNVDDKKNHQKDITAQTEEDKTGEENKQRKVQVKGSVMFGWVEPEPVGSFIMREATANDETSISSIYDDDEDDEDEDEDENDIDIEKMNDIFASNGDDDDNDDDIDWSDSFQ